MAGQCLRKLADSLIVSDQQDGADIVRQSLQSRQEGCFGGKVEILFQGDGRGGAAQPVDQRRKCLPRSGGRGTEDDLRPGTFPRDMAGHEVGRAFPPVVQRPFVVGLSRIAPCGLGVAQEECSFHGRVPKNP